MKVLTLLALLFQVSCAVSKPETLVRITVYWKDSDKWTKKGLTSTGDKLKNMGTCAVDPKTIPYFSTIKVRDTNPPLNLKCNDTGSAVVSRKAAKKMGKNVPVVDVFFERKSEALKFANSNPLFVNVEINGPPDIKKTARKLENRTGWQVFSDHKNSG